MYGDVMRNVHIGSFSIVFVMVFVVVKGSQLRCTGENDGCCTVGRPCGLGEGDCDGNDECKEHLLCGKRNCIWGDNDDCCRYRCAGEKDGCCGPYTPCEPGEGHCTMDDDCKGPLTCGKNNCQWGNNDSCCELTMKKKVGYNCLSCKAVNESMCNATQVPVKCKCNERCMTLYYVVDDLSNDDAVVRTSIYVKKCQYEGLECDIYPCATFHKEGHQESKKYPTCKAQCCDGEKCNENVHIGAASAITSMQYSTLIFITAFSYHLLQKSN